MIILRSSTHGDGGAAAGTTARCVLPSGSGARQQQLSPLPVDTFSLSSLDDDFSPHLTGHFNFWAPTDIQQYPEQIGEIVVTVDGGNTSDFLIHTSS
ncbi:hypothetical protein PoB_000167400 [Plakobranchus ocellatus]|uniref:Uncharacterized protein n=1 Tax=Plakobranchus ocellatus TaxID=259542 RepID=A0AAV3XZ03_9GAST|nr:hypothetical protein PoB_000167400 [Plakobranchus ocellatus]